MDSILTDILRLVHHGGHSKILIILKLALRNLQLVKQLNEPLLKPLVLYLQIHEWPLFDAHYLGSMVHPGDFASGLFAVVISSLLHSKEPSSPTLNSSSFQNLGGQILQTKTWNFHTGLYYYLMYSQCDKHWHRNWRNANTDQYIGLSLYWEEYKKMHWSNASMD